MTTQEQDPISEIKKAEESVKKELETKTENLEQKLKNLEKELSKKTEEFEESRKEQGNLKLNNVKKEAGELYKSKMATSENLKNQSVRSAEEKKKDAIDSITKYFLDHIK